MNNDVFWEKKIQLWDKDGNVVSPEPSERGFTYLQVVPAFRGAKRVMTTVI